MSSEEEDENAVYCICRSSDVNRFMIGCDHCEEWYHGDCIKVNERDATLKSITARFVPIKIQSYKSFINRSIKKKKKRY